jgi:lipopolysaccharide transport system permease protein
MSMALKQPEDDAEAESVFAESRGHPGEAATSGDVTPAPRARQGPPSPPRRVTRIAAASPWYETGLGETTRSWELLLVFTWRLISVQYKQAALGIGWAVLSPLLSTLVFSFVFGKLAGLPSDGAPYPVFVLSGLITWQYFSRYLDGKRQHPEQRRHHY